jgi:hypothetical protein
MLANLPALVGLCLLLQAVAGPVAAQQMSVQANDRKFNGQAWDGVEAFAPLSVPTTTPPDLAVCVVPLNGAERCIERQTARERQSLCQNSFSCTFELGVNVREPFGLFIYDIDLRWDDLVDFLIVVPEARMPPARYAPIERRLREMLTDRTETLNPTENSRRRRDTFVVTPEQCREGCPLSQSRVWFR